MEGMAQETIAGAAEQPQTHGAFHSSAEAAAQQAAAAAAEAPPGIDADMQEGADAEEEVPCEARNAAAAHLREWFTPEEAAGERKLKRRNSGEEPPDRPNTPSEPEASSWLHGAVGDALCAFGKYVETKLHRVGVHVMKMDERLGDTENMVSHLARDTADLADRLMETYQKQETNIETLEKGFDKWGQGYTETERIVFDCVQNSRTTDKKWRSSSRKSQPWSGRSQTTPRPPRSTRAQRGPTTSHPGMTGPPRIATKEERQAPQQHHAAPNVVKSVAGLGIENSLERWRHARLGNVGWDAPSDVLLNRATDILQELGVTESVVVSMAASVSRAGVGSSVEILFDTPGSLQAAKIKLRTKVVQIEDRRVWLDIQKSRAVLRPARLIHRAAELLQQVEAERIDAKDVEKNAGAKHIDIGGNRGFFSLRSELKATTWAQQRYSKDKLIALREYDEAD